MALKNASTKTWSLVPSFDGVLWSTYPSGNKPSGFQTAPTLLATDIVAGSTTGGENGKGAYLSLFGYSFGRQADLGTAQGARVYIGGVEVDNYRYLGLSKVYPRTQIMQLICQVGALGGQTGALDVKITVNGVDSNILTGGFYVQPGRFAFVSLTGNDTTAVFDDPSRPFRYVQNYSGSNPVAGSLWDTTTAQGEPGLRPGDTIVMRGGVWTDQTGFEGKMCRFRNQTGTSPNGSTGNGYYHFVNYPGPVKGNTPEVVKWACPTNGAGLMHGCGTTNAGLGYGKYWSISGMVMTNAADSVGAPSDSGLINLQNGADYVRIINNELGPYTWSDPAPSLKTGGISGVSVSGTFQFNYIHDIQGSPALENHGIYMGGADNNGYQQCSQNCEISYNWLYNVSGGSLFQYNWAVTQMPSNKLFSGNKVHHNYMDGCAKYGINLGPSYKDGLHYNNIILNTNWASIRFDIEITGLTGASVGGHVSYNTIYNPCPTGASYNSAISVEYIIPTGTIYCEHNLIVLGPNRSSNSTTYYVNGASVGADNNLTIDQCVYYDAKAINPSLPSKDTHAINGNPNFKDTVTGSAWVFTANSTDFTCVSGGAGINTATIAGNYSPTTDFYGIARPQAGTRDIGACEGIGT